MEVEVVIHNDDKKPNDSTVTRKRADTQDVAKQAIQLVLGSDNDYLQRLLADKLEGKERTYKRIPLTKLVHGNDRKQLRENLAQAASSSQRAAIEVLYDQIEPDIERGTNTQPQLVLGDKNQAITSWVLNTVLHEKLKDRENRESADYWKYINGGLAIVLPILTGILDHFLTSYFQKCNCESE